MREISSLLLGTKTLFYQYFQDFFRPTSPRHRSSSPSRTCRHHGGRRGVTQRTLRHIAGPFSRPLSIMTMIPPVRAFQKSEQRKAWPQVQELTWKAIRKVLRRIYYCRFSGVPRFGTDHSAWGRFIGVYLYFIGVLL